MTTDRPYYITTPIYYVNDRPHIGHCYTTLLADAAARFQRLARGLDIDGKDEPTRAGSAPAGPAGRVFFLTGTDEHADKVVTSGAEHGVSPLEWATRNADQFRAAFAAMNFSQDDFIRTTEDRHKTRVHGYIRQLQAGGDIYLGDYVGWWDESQEEYLTETVAKDSKFGPYTSPVTGRPLVKRTEKNYFFRLSKYETALRAHIDAHPECILPEARRNEVLGRLRQGLQDVPISRAVTDDPTTQWGIRMPDDPGHRVYVWIEALCNYLTVVDTPGRKDLWPASVHVMAKDILWFHAVIWPAMLMALSRTENIGKLGLPSTVYAHSYWVREGVKMSKSLGNFVTLEVLKAYADKYSLDAVRWYLLTQGPLGATDADFSHAKFIEVYNADLANGVGNCASRVSNMIAKYFDGKVPERAPTPISDVGTVAQDLAAEAARCQAKFDLDSGLLRAVSLISRVDLYINETQPFKLAKRLDAEPQLRATLGHILYDCAEAIRIAALLLMPAMPQKMTELLAKWGSTPPAGVPLADLVQFAGPYGLNPGTAIVKGEALFMRADPAEPPPA
ncbi:MAG: class I tRNA ligase family protein [Phycisphaerales bacterium]|nr:class I tRNA ligase family protein [Phycisphaerales bacterium]